MRATPRHPPLHLQQASLYLALAGMCAAAPFIAEGDVPCDSPQAAEQPEPSVQIGFRYEMRSGVRGYVYTVLNRSQDTLTVVQVGWDSDREICELTGARPHVPPDTAYSPPGWECEPLQDKDPMMFALGWKLGPSSAESGGVPPNTQLSEFTVALSQPDSLYERCHWLIRFKSRPKAGYIGTVRPEAELDAISSETGTISGRVTDERDRGIPGVHVYVKRTALSALTRSDGRYTLSTVPVGAQSLVARKVGFEPCARVHMRVAASGMTKVDFRLPSFPDATPCVPYGTANERIELPFPGGAIDTVGAHFLERSAPVPPRLPGDTSRPEPFVYSLTNSEVSLVYRGLGQDTIPRAFVATVNRGFRNAEEERLLRIAEETYPPTEAVLSIAGSRRGREALSKEKRLWWYDKFDGVRLPYAVTMDAVRYYLALTQALGRGDTTETKGIRMKSSEFSYHANISARPATYSRDGRVFKDVYVVEMGLKWSNYCGSLCACWFHLDRTVVLRRDGTVLCVFGDQKPMVVVS